MTPRRVLIVKPSALGDIAHALPVLGALKGKWPGAGIDWLANAAFAPLLDGHPLIHEVLRFDRARYKSAPLAALSYSRRFAHELRRRRYDLVIDLQGLARTGLMTLATGAPVRVGFANAREGSRLAYTHVVRVPDAESIHAVERYWRVAEYLGAGDAPKHFGLPVRPERAAEAAGLLAGLPRPVVAVAAGARWLTKRWPAGHFAECLNRAHAEFGASVVLVGAPDDGELHAELAKRLAGPALDLTGKTPLPLLAAVLASADAVFANDTGPLHLAVALGRKCVAPYTCTSVVKHGPYGQLARGVPTTVPCAASYLRQCPHGLVCFGELTPDRVYPALAEALSP